MPAPTARALAAALALSLAAASGGESYTAFLGWAMWKWSLIIWVGLVWALYQHTLSGLRHLVMDIGVEMTSGSGYVSDFDWEAKDADGRVWNCTSGGIYFNPGLPSGEVHAPDKVRGFVGCDLPRSDVTVIWDDELKWAVLGA